MARFIFRRILSSIPVLIGILIVTFALIHALPGDPCIAVLGERATEEICEAYMKHNGLDKPLPVQFGIYITNILQGDLGDSLRFHRPVVEILIERLPVTIELGLAALMFAIFVGIPLGIISAYRHKSKFDLGTMIIANIGVSMPVFWLGLMLSYLFGVLLMDTPLTLPPSGRLTPGTYPEPFYLVWGWVIEGEKPAGILVFISRLNILNCILTFNGGVLVDAIRHLILPAITVGTIPLAIIARMTRSSLLEVLGEDYVRTARAKGVREFVVVIKHAGKNSLLPVVTVIGLNFGLIISGAVLTETIFGLTGVGRTLVESITSRDYTLVQGFTVIIAMGFVLINMIVDIIYGIVDPRIRLS